MRFCVCIITRDEEEKLKRNLSSMKIFTSEEIGWEIVVLDTGSTDYSKEIAQSFEAKVYDFVWQDDFAIARNIAADKADFDMIIVLDSDEYFPEMSLSQAKLIHSQLSELVEEHPFEIGQIERVNLMNTNNQSIENREWIGRIYNRTAFSYQGRIHEQLIAIDGGASVFYHTPISILHTGYLLSEEERKKKADRNRRLLLEELEYISSQNKKDLQIPYLLYQLGKSEYLVKSYQQACDYFAQGLSFDLDPKLEYVADMVEMYGYALINSHQAQVALGFEGDIYGTFATRAEFVFLMGLIYMNNEMFDKAIAEFQKATRYQTSSMQGVNSYLANYNIGIIYECLGEFFQAIIYYKKAVGYKPAEDRIAQMEEKK